MGHQLIKDWHGTSAHSSVPTLHAFAIHVSDREVRDPVSAITTQSRAGAQQLDDRCARQCGATYECSIAVHFER